MEGEGVGVVEAPGTEGERSEPGVPGGRIVRAIRRPLSTGTEATVLA